MNSIQTALSDALKAREIESGATLTWAGTEVPCSGSPVLGGKSLMAGGYRATAQAVIVIRIASFQSGLPAEKQTVSFKASPDGTAKTLRIDTVNNVADVALELECDEA